MCFMEKKGKVSLNYPSFPFLSGALQKSVTFKTLIILRCIDTFKGEKLLLFSFLQFF